MERELHHKIVHDFGEIKEMLRVRLHCSELSYRTWIEALDVLKIEDDCIWLILKAEANQKEIASYLTMKYKALFEKTIEAYSGANFNVHFIVKSEVELELMNQVFTNPDFTFDTFVVGEENRFAYEVAGQAVENPATYSPIIFYGKTGCGKSLLLQGIANECHRKNQKVYFTSAELFIYDVIEAFRLGDPEKKQAFVETYITSPDLLIVDNIDRLEGLTIQEEFRRICLYYFRKQKQLVFASNLHPSEFDIGISHLPFYEYAVIAEVEAPNLATRVEIANREFAKQGIVLASDTVGEYLAECLEDVRKLKEIIRKITRELADSGCQNKDITLAMVEEIIEQHDLI